MANIWIALLFTAHHLPPAENNVVEGIASPAPIKRGIENQSGTDDAPWTFGASLRLLEQTALLEQSPPQGEGKGEGKIFAQMDVGRLTLL